MKEVIDIFDGNHRHIGTEERTVAHQKGSWHQTFHCWITGRTKGLPFLLFQLRSMRKRNFPGMLDITAAGHLSIGEAPQDGIRELEEELGIRPSREKLHYLGIKHDVADEANDVHNREFAHVFLLDDSRELSEYRLQEDEVVGLVRMSLKDGLALFSQETPLVRCLAIQCERGVAREFERTVALDNFIPRVDPYYLKVCIMAERLHEDKRHLAI
jgi:isopentenyldiphosphate isomerase